MRFLIAVVIGGHVHVVPTGDGGGLPQTTIDNFVKMVEKWKNLAPSTPISRLLEMILLDSGYRSMLEADKEDDGWKT